MVLLRVCRAAAVHARRLPVGPDWNDVRRLLDSASGNTPHDIRDTAILQLFAVYGFRCGEVAELRLDDLHWAQDRICLRRPKQRCVQAPGECL